MSHLCFADDLLIFFDASSQSLQGIIEVMEEFYVFSGLKVSFGKSEIFYGGILEANQHQLAALLGLKVGKLPVRYSGVPLITGKLKFDDCLPLINKMTVRITSWSSRILSFAGRLQLIDSVLCSITNFWCSMLLLPKKVIKRVEQICNAFCGMVWQIMLQVLRLVGRTFTNLKMRVDWALKDYQNGTKHILAV